MSRARERFFRRWPTRAYRRPVTEAETQVLLDFYRAGRTEEKTLRCRHSARPRARAGRAELHLQGESSRRRPTLEPRVEAVVLPVEQHSRRRAAERGDARQAEGSGRARAAGAPHAARSARERARRRICHPLARAEQDRRLRPRHAAVSRVRRKPARGDGGGNASCSSPISFGRIAASPICCSPTTPLPTIGWRSTTAFPNVYGSHYRPVKFTDRRRGGLLGQASVLSVTSYPNRTSVVMRGRWLLANMLGAPPPPPPLDVPALKEPGAGRAAEVAARADGSAPQESRVRVVPSAHGSARLLAREFRRRRQVARRGRWRAGRSERVAARRHAVRGRRRAAHVSGRAQGRFRQNAQRQAARVCDWARHRVLRSAGDPKDRARGRGERLSVVVGDSRSGEQHAVQRAAGRARSPEPEREWR